MWPTRFPVDTERRRSRRTRAEATAGQAEAAVEAVKKELIPGNVARVTSRMTWGYRYLEATTSHEGIIIEDWEDDAAAAE